MADPHQSEVMELMIHEQYFYPDFHGDQPDFREKVETAIKFVVDRGYEPVFLQTVSWVRFKSETVECAPLCRTARQGSTLIRMLRKKTSSPSP